MTQQEQFTEDLIRAEHSIEFARSHLQHAYSKASPLAALTVLDLCGLANQLKAKFDQFAEAYRAEVTQ